MGKFSVSISDELRDELSEWAESLSKLERLVEKLADLIPEEEFDETDEDEL